MTPGPTSMAIFLLALVAGCVGVVEFVKRRAAGCDACRIERDGGRITLMPHTCSSARALYRDRKGNVYEFGELRKNRPTRRPNDFKEVMPGKTLKFRTKAR